MSGHSKWSTIKRAKGANDAKRGQAFTKASKLITIAARDGASADTNFKLRLAVEAARAINMPKENIERAIARATGGDGAKQLEESVYEGYGPSGVALLIEVVTDNKMRTAAEIRSILDKSGGSLAAPGSVDFNFKTTGIITVNLSDKDSDELFLLAADSGAEDITTEALTARVFCKPELLHQVKEAIDTAGYSVESSEVTKEPSSTVKITDESKARSVLNLIEKLEDCEDVQKVYTNFDIPNEILERNAELTTK